MAILRFTANLTPDNFPVHSRVRAAQAKIYGLDEARNKEDLTPTWIENFWAISKDQLGTVYLQNPDVDAIPAEILQRIRQEQARSQLVDYNGQQAVVVYGKSFICTLTDTGWAVNYLGANYGVINVTTLKGVTYFLIQGTGVFTYGTNLVPFDIITPVAFTGIDATQIISLTSSISYLVATDTDTVYYSSPLNPLYWTPNGTGVDYGAGATNVLALRSPINFIVSAKDGFYIFTGTNIIYAAYTNNPDIPWYFTEVDNSSGVYDQYNALSDVNTGTFIVWSTVGIGFLEGATLTYSFPEVTELLSGSTYEYWDYDTKQVVRETRAKIDGRIQFVNKRFLCVSYGQADTFEYSYLLVYDTLLRLWSRISVPHGSTLHWSDSVRGFRFVDWTQSFWDTEMTFADMLAQSIEGTGGVLQIAILTAEGRIQLLTPTTKTSRQLFNVLEFGELSVSRGRDLELTAITLYGQDDFPEGGGAISISNYPVPYFLNSAYSFQFEATGYTEGAEWEVSSGQLPPGFSLSTAGVLSGVAFDTALVGDYTFGIRVWNAAGSNDTITVTFRVTALDIYLPLTGDAGDTTTVRYNLATIPVSSFGVSGTVVVETDSGSSGGSRAAFLTSTSRLYAPNQTGPVLTDQFSVRGKVRITNTGTSVILGRFGNSAGGATGQRKGWALIPTWRDGKFAVALALAAGGINQKNWTTIYYPPLDAPTFEVDEVVRIGIAVLPAGIRTFTNDYYWEKSFPIGTVTYDGSNVRFTIGGLTPMSFGITERFYGTMDEIVVSKLVPEFYDDFPAELFDYSIAYPVSSDPDNEPALPPNPIIDSGDTPDQRNLEVMADSDYNPELRTYLTAKTEGITLQTVNRVRGRKVRAVVQNAGSLQGVELSVITTGVRR